MLMIPETRCFLQAIDAPLKINKLVLVAEEPEQPYQGNGLREHGSDGRSLNAHIKSEDEKRVEQRVDNHRHDRCEHGFLRMSGRTENRIQPQVRMSDDISQKE